MRKTHEMLVLSLSARVSTFFTGLFAVTQAIYRQHV